MVTDSLVINPGRLRILMGLASGGVQEFVQLRASVRLTDGNLVTHARRLESAGLIQSTKARRAGRGVTTFAITEAGRTELRRRADELVDALRGTGQIHANLPEGAEETVEDWID